MSSGRYTAKQTLMGSSFDLGITCDDQAKAEHLLKIGIAEIERIERELTEFDADSITGQLNQNAGENPVVVSDEFMQLMKRCGHIYRLSQGYFDPTAGPLKSLYSFQGDRISLPDDDLLKKTLTRVGFDKVEFHPEKNTIYLPLTGMRLSFAAIGKGYAADRVRMIWQQQQVKGGYINASGDLSTFGVDEKGEAWTVGIADPNQEGSSLLHLPLSNKAMATSGYNYQFFVNANRRYSHNINPKNGRAVTGIKSVSVISPSAELSDALATGIHAMGVEKGMSFANQLPATYTIIIDDNNRIHFSKNLDYAAIS